MDGQVLRNPSLDYVFSARVFQQIFPTVMPGPNLVEWRYAGHLVMCLVVLLV